ncbi:hypothetical protein LGR54_04450 [Ancylobacter sp. Lp-2]|uniref:hypothetical protein n=1 Tax=Ancylobacter sp. Lp-2 TaxID=2881339 RepID=UPI001E5CD47A|nr:hypothetical protein [Ancylobacter sp. Lp-2]MCB4767845.1 hypothetical protein [Ancylobacter sp. Lp-2]
MMLDTGSYFDGMFQNDPMEEENVFTVASYLETVCHHEAAHAVTMYAMGNLLESVGVCANYAPDASGKKSVCYSGLARPRSRKGAHRVSIDFDYRALHFKLGVTLAAGPAGERRHCIEREKPIRLLIASEGDHHGIDSIVRTLFARGRDGYAFQRLVWRAAQRIVAKPTVWKAICDVGDELFNIAADAEEAEDGNIWAYIEPGDVYSICRRNGVTRGMLLPSAGDRHVPIFPAPAVRAA